MENISQRENELLFVRELNAPRELVFDVWTQSEHLSKWWGPNGFTLTTDPMIAAAGVTWKFMMHGPDGTNFLNKINFIEVKRPESIIYNHVGEGDTKDISFEVNIRFETIGNNEAIASEASQKTRLTMNMIFETAAGLQYVAKEFGAIEGAVQHLARLETYIYTL